MGRIGGFLKGGLGNFKAGTKGTMAGGFSDIFRKGGEIKLVQILAWVDC